MDTRKRVGLVGALLLILGVTACGPGDRKKGDGPFQGDGEWIRVALRVRPWQGKTQPIVELYKKMGFQAVAIHERDHTAAVSSFHRPPEFVLLPVVTLDLTWGELAGIGVMRDLPGDPMEALEVIELWKGVSLLSVSDWSNVPEALLDEVDLIECLDGDGRCHSQIDIRPGSPWIATSDFSKTVPFGCPGEAWIEVWAKTNEAQSIIDSIRRGFFYSTRGPRFERIHCLNRRVSVELMQEATVSLIGPGGAMLAHATTRSVSFRVDPKYEWVRLEAEDSDGRCAWTQPILM